MEIFSAFKGLSLRPSRSCQNGLEYQKPADSKPPRPPKASKRSKRKAAEAATDAARRESRARSHGLSSRESSRAGSPASIRSSLSLNLSSRWAEFRNRRASSPVGSERSFASQSIATSLTSKVTSPESPLVNYRVVDSVGPLSQRHLSLRRSMRETCSPSWSSASSIRWSSGRFPPHRLPPQPRRPNSSQFFGEGNAAAAILSACKFPVEQFRSDLYLDPNQDLLHSSEETLSRPLWIRCKKGSKVVAELTVLLGPVEELQIKAWKVGLAGH